MKSNEIQGGSLELSGDLNRVPIDYPKHLYLHYKDEGKMASLYLNVRICNILKVK